MFLVSLMDADLVSFFGLATIAFVGLIPHPIYGLMDEESIRLDNAAPKRRGVKPIESLGLFLWLLMLRIN